MNKKLLNGVIFTIASIILLILPTGVLIYIKRDEWLTASTGTDVSMGVMIGLAYVLLIMKGALKDIDKKLTTLISMLVVLGVVWFIEDIINDLFWIVSSATVGYLLYIIMSLIGKSYINYYKAYRNEKARVVARAEPQSPVGV